MPVSLEMYILINLCMNFITIGAIARARGRVRWRAVAFASVYGALYAVLMQTPAFQLLRAWPLRLLLGLAMVMSALEVDGPKDLGSAWLLMMGATLLMGGVQLLLNRMLSGPSAIATLAAAGCGGALLLVILNARAERLNRLDAQLMLRMGDSQVRLTALIDTGNRLHEPLSGLPVLIVTEKRLKKLLPPGFDAIEAAERVPLGFRLVGYGALGGGGKMAVFRPDELLVSYGDGWMLAPDVWVGVYPGEMPGKVHALAPGVIGCIQPTKRRIERVGISQMRGKGQ